MLRQIASNTLAQLVAKILGVIFALATTLLVVRLGGPAVFGDLTKVLALLAIGATVIDFGLNAAAVRQMEHDASSQARLYSSVLSARLLLSLFAAIALNAVVWFLPGGYTPEVKRAFSVASLALIFHGLYISTNALFQRRLTYWRSALASTLGAATVTAATYLVLLEGPSLFPLALASTLGYLVAGLTGLILARIIPRLSFTNALGLIRESLWLGATLVLSVLASRTDMIILGVLRPSFEVAEYGLSYRAFEVVLTLPTFIMNAVYPLLTSLAPRSRAKVFRLSTRALLILGLLAAFIGYLSSPLLTLIRADFAPSVPLFRLLLLSLPLFFVTSPLMWELIARRKERALFGVYLLAALGNIGLNLWLVPLFGATASALVTGATEAAVLLALLYLIKRGRNLKQ